MTVKYWKCQPYASFLVPNNQHPGITDGEVARVVLVLTHGWGCQAYYEILGIDRQSRTY